MYIFFKLVNQRQLVIHRIIIRATETMRTCTHTHTHACACTHINARTHTHTNTLQLSLFESKMKTKDVIFPLFLLFLSDNLKWDNDSITWMPWQTSADVSAKEWVLHSSGSLSMKDLWNFCLEWLDDLPALLSSHLQYRRCIEGFPVFERAAGFLLPWRWGPAGVFAEKCVHDSDV